MIVVNPITNTPEDNWTASATDAAGTCDAGAQGRATAEHVSLFEMATEGLPVDPPTHKDALRASYELGIQLQSGQRVHARVEAQGHRAVSSIAEARSLRIFLAYRAGRLDNITQDDRYVSLGVSLLDIAEIRTGIRHRNGAVRPEWQ